MNFNSLAPVESFGQKKLSKSKSSTKTFWFSASVVLCGVVWMALLSQVKIVLPWTPVPITGQTFGVAVMALLFGSRLSVAAYASYLMIGFMGLPVFAGLKSGLTWGPTMGYLVGMLLSALVIGRLADKGWGQSFGKSLMACYVGSFLTFACGLFVLSFFIPQGSLLAAGLIPFLPGDLVKNLLAAAVVSKASRKG